MTDKELLEYAAKAASTSADGTMFNGWNPLENDGDALRLAVWLNFNIKIFEDVAVVDDVFGSGWSEIFCGDPYAATRRAITSAAAEIGKE
jgi:hypothetical protein